MPIDTDVALSAAPTVRDASWTERDVILYHLGLGAGVDSLDPAELRWVYEKDLRVLPTFAMVAGQGVSAGAVTQAGLSLRESTSTCAGSCTVASPSTCTPRSRSRVRRPSRLASPMCGTRTRPP